VGKKQDAISKITLAKRAEGVAQVVEYLCCKCKALSSNTSDKKKNLEKVFCIKLKIPNQLRLIQYTLNLIIIFFKVYNNKNLGMLYQMTVLNSINQVYNYDKIFRNKLLESPAGYELV
jgi:hypothetical protein